MLMAATNAAGSSEEGGGGSPFDVQSSAGWLQPFGFGFMLLLAEVSLEIFTLLSARIHAEVVLVVLSLLRAYCRDNTAQCCGYGCEEWLGWWVGQWMNVHIHESNHPPGNCSRGRCRMVDPRNLRVLTPLDI